MEKTGSSRKKGLKRKSAAEDPQEAAVGEDGATESGGQGPKASAFPPGFSISEIKNKQRRHLMFTRWKQQQRKVGEGRRRQGACAVSLARGWACGTCAVSQPRAPSRRLGRGSRSPRPAFCRSGRFPFFTISWLGFVAENESKKPYSPTSEKYSLLAWEAKAPSPRGPVHLQLRVVDA